MAWSPRQLAELAGTSRRAVRHYHEIGLLAEPERQLNGYGRYGVDHLLRLLRIRRLTRLGLTLSQVAALGEADGHPAPALRTLDATLAGDIERLHQTRLELAAMLEQAAPTDLPTELAGRVRGLPAAERALVVVLTRLLGPAGLEAYLGLLAPYRDHAAVVAFDHLPDDADEQSRNAVAVGLGQHLHNLSTHRQHQIDLVDRDLVRGPRPKQTTVREAVDDLYGPAQLDVLWRAHRLAGWQRPWSSAPQPRDRIPQDRRSTITI